MSDYELTIVREYNNLDSFISLINEKMQEGWSRVGEFQVLVVDSKNREFYQMMSRYTPGMRRYKKGEEGG